MDKIKELTDFYMWMQENDYDHNIRARVERKAEIYLNGINAKQKLPIHSVSNSIATKYADFCVRCDREKLPLLCLEDYIKQYCG